MSLAVFSSKIRLKIGIIGGLLLAPSILFAAQQAPAKPTLPVAVKTVHKQDIAVYSEYSARTRATQQTEVYARVSGILEKKFFTEGQIVKAGQRLYKIDDRKYRASVVKAKAELAVAQANYNKAEREYKRVKGLYKNKAVSEQEVDNALSALELAKATIEGQKAALNEVQIDLDYTDVKAQISGVTGMKQQDIGNLVGSTAENALLTTITQLEQIHAVFAIPDANFSQMTTLSQQGKLELLEQTEWKAELLDAQNQIIASGKVDFVGNQIDTSTGGVQTRALFDNQKLQLLPGQFVRLRVTNALRKNIFVIPQKAVLQMGQQAFVYVVKDGIADLLPVQLADQQGDNWLVESGLKEGDQVVLNNLIKLRPKTPVQIMPADSEKSQAVH
ncbi:hemolysin D [Thiomicrorhabdus immobilis]|uniref:Hemolysin D n=1 Tax=Thiomicrorhabdus immobilis TaxID=2791037 RepID=A0ABN6CXK0_9GAMM|nr:efflux RND transporter periplasmic adaptor subunit [Thiomicrorhabdus immobilis]BCN92610.1 hemolysin D [Thiomicrorhabdus immobilis]